MTRRALVFAAVLLAASLCAAQQPELPSVRLNADSVVGKTIEDLTGQALARDYAKAWRTLAIAFDKNQAYRIDNDFVGVAADKLSSAVAMQARSGLHRRYVDRGHQVQALFYSPDGTSVELRDTANFEVQYMDGDKVLHTENGTKTYIALMTPTEIRWKVRVLQEVEK
ncbi:MAG: hypothetical protein ACRD3E_13775 [Terriglobales bacterium]